MYLYKYGHHGIPYVGEQFLDRCDTGVATVCISDVAHRGPLNARGVCLNTETHGKLELVFNRTKSFHFKIQYIRYVSDCLLLVGYAIQS